MEGAVIARVANLSGQHGRLSPSAAVAAVFADAATASPIAPTQLLIGNPAPLKRAIETGGASRGAVPVQLPNWPALQRVDAVSSQAVPPRVGEDLAVTSGAVVYLDAVCEVIRSVVPYSGRQGRVHERR